ncbi:MAG: preprotein translocase subunit YajC [Candidatus Omnitrophota bacterium]
MFESAAYAMSQAPQAQGQGAPNPLASMPIMLLMMFGIMYFLVIRPQQKKQKDHEKMISELKKNDDIITTGGVHGTIVNVKDNTFTVRVDDNVKIEISKSAIAGVKEKKEK